MVQKGYDSCLTDIVFNIFIIIIGHTLKDIRIKTFKLLNLSIFIKTKQLIARIRKLCIKNIVNKNILYFKN